MRSNARFSVVAVTHSLDCESSGIAADERQCGSAAHAAARPPAWRAERCAARASSCARQECATVHAPGRTRPTPPCSRIIWATCSLKPASKLYAYGSCLARLSLGRNPHLRIPRHPATQSTLIRPGIPRTSGHLFHGHPAGQSERSDARVALLVRGARRRQFLRPFAHRLALEVDPVGVVHQAVEDGIGQGRIADHAGAHGQS